MPKPLEQLDDMTMRTFDVAAMQHATSPECLPEHNLVTHLSSERLLVQAATTMALDAEVLVNPHEIARRGTVLIDKARDQSYGLLSAAWSVLPRSVSREELPEWLRNSDKLGQLFGHVTSEPRRDRQTNDDALLFRLMGRSDVYLTPDIERKRIEFTKEGIKLLRPHISDAVGCPALTHTVSSDGGMTKDNLFRVAWGDFTEAYIQERVVPVKGVAARFRRLLSVTGMV